MTCVSCVACRMCFFFKQKTAYEMRISDWSSDVGSSDLCRAHGRVLARAVGAARWTLPDHAPARAQLIEPVRLVPVRAYRQDLAFPGAGGDGKTFELCEYQFERRRHFALETGRAECRESVCTYG